MLTHEELEELYSECGRSYTDAELRLHSEHRLLKSELEIEHGNNHRAIDLTDKWSAYILGAGKRPTRLVGNLIFPGRHLQNDRCLQLEDIFAQFKAFGPGKCPMLPILVYASRSAATLFEKLNELYPSDHMDAITLHFQNLLALVTNYREDITTQEQFEQEIDANLKALIAALSAYAVEVNKFLRGEVRNRNEEEKKKSQVAAIKNAVTDEGRQTRQAIARDGQKTRATVTKDGGQTRATVKAGTAKVTQTVIKATHEEFEACHHPDKAKDKIVQQVIAYLAKPGVVFSIHNACVRVSGRGTGGSCENAWLYKWCKRHADALRTASEMAAGR